MDLEQKVFKKTKYSDILEKIYINSNKKEKRIEDLITQLKDQVIDIHSALQVVPLIKGYLDAGIKNDENNIKLAAILQRAITSTDGGGDFEISDQEREQLLEIAKSSSTLPKKSSSKVNEK